MMTALDHPKVQDYLRRLHEETVRLPADEGRELETQIREHLEEALRDDPSEADVRSTLDRVGDPAELVDAAGGARPGPGASPAAPHPAWREVVALVLLVGSAVMFWLWPVAGLMWVAGLVLLVLATRWSVTEKILGALVLGLTPWLVMLVAGVAFVTTAQTCTGDGSATVCTGGGTGLTATNIVAIGLTVAVGVLYLWTLVRLARAAARADGPLSARGARE